MIGTGAYVKFWTAMAMPLIIAFIVYSIYAHHMSQVHHDGLEDLVVDATQRKKWAAAKRDAKRAHVWDHHNSKWKAAHPEAAPREEKSKLQKGQGQAVHHLMLQRAIDVANARQLCVGWGFMLI
eukprot:COSAG06_NODE_34657_length_471_cov_1.010753_1_plen_123_part_10